MSNPTVAVNMIVRNEVKRLKILFPIIRDFFDEIVIVDQESTDKTAELCESWADKIIPDEATGNADTSRQLAMDNTDSDWILTLDADEFVTTRLEWEMPELIKAPDYVDGYMINLGDIIIEDNEPYDLSSYLRFGKSVGDIIHDSWPHKYRLYRNRPESIILNKELHRALIIPHKATVIYLAYNAIIHVKTRAEHKIDADRYEAVAHGYYDKDKFI